MVCQENINWIEQTIFFLQCVMIVQKRLCIWLIGIKQKPLKYNIILIPYVLQ